MVIHFSIYCLLIRIPVFFTILYSFLVLYLMSNSGMTVRYICKVTKISINTPQNEKVNSTCTKGVLLTLQLSLTLLIGGLGSTPELLPQPNVLNGQIFHGNSCPNVRDYFMEISL